jgi:hypothetical protein
MTVVVWLADGTWATAVDAARRSCRRPPRGGRADPPGC